jgi:hypothetical protein
MVISLKEKRFCYCDYIRASIAHSVQWLGYELDEQRIGVKITAGAEVFLFSTMSRPAVVPTRLPIQWALGALYLWCWPLISYLVLRLRMPGAMLHFPCIFMMWCLIKYFYCYFYEKQYHGVCVKICF